MSLSLRDRGVIARRATTVTAAPQVFYTDLAGLLYADGTPVRYDELAAPPPSTGVFYSDGAGLLYDDGTPVEYL